MMRRLSFIILSCCIAAFAYGQNNIPANVQKLISVYPQCIKGYGDNYILFADGSKLLYDDGKSNKDLLNNADVEDMFSMPYVKGETQKPAKNEDPGRIRNDEFFKKMYGTTAAEVQRNLVEITWCPKLLNQKLRVTKVNDVHKQLLKVSAELDEHPEWKDYLRSSGVFNWRVISGSKRLSTHSFGTAIDINTKYSNYWQWDCKCTNEEADVSYKNRIPQGIVAIFEKYGFIWGGKWYHYDTMHFEYRPELLK